MKKSLLFSIILSGLLFSGCDLFSDAVTYLGQSVPTMTSPENLYYVASAGDLIITTSATDMSQISVQVLTGDFSVSSTPGGTPGSPVITIDKDNPWGNDQAAEYGVIRVTVNLGTRQKFEDFHIVLYNTDFSFVSTTGNDGNSGLSPTLPKSTFNSALGIKSKVAVAAGTYTVTNPASFVNMTGSQSLYGGYHPSTWQRDYNQNVTTIKDDSVDVNSSYAILIGGANCLVDGFTLMSGKGAGTSSVISIGASNPSTIKNCTLSFPIAAALDGYYYGILINGVANVTVDNCTFTNIENGTSLYMIAAGTPSTGDLAVINSVFRPGKIAASGTNSHDYRAINTSWYNVTVTGSTFMAAQFERDTTSGTQPTIFYNIFAYGDNTHITTLTISNNIFFNSSIKIPSINSNYLEVHHIRSSTTGTKTISNNTFYQNDITLSNSANPQDITTSSISLYPDSGSNNTTISENTFHAGTITNSGAGAVLYSVISMGEWGSRKYVSGVIQENIITGSSITHNGGTTDLVKASPILINQHASTGTLSISNNTITGGNVTLTGYAGTSGSPHVINGITILNSSPNTMTISENSITAGTITRGNTANYYISSAGLYSEETQADMTLNRNSIQGANASTGITDSSKVAGIQSRLDGEKTVNIFNNIVYSGSLDQSVNALTTYVAGIILEGSKTYNVHNNSIVSGHHPYASAPIIFTAVWVGDDNSYRFSNNILVATGSGTSRWGMVNMLDIGISDQNIQYCKNSLFIDNGSGGSYYPYRELNINRSIDTDLGYSVYPGNLSDNGSRLENSSSPLFVNLSGTDGLFSTLSDNNWHLSPSASLAVRYGGLTASGVTLDISGTARTATFPEGNPGNANATGWSMGAYEY